MIMSIPILNKRQEDTWSSHANKQVNIDSLGTLQDAL